MPNYIILDEQEHVVVSTTLPATAVKNTLYNLGEKSSLSIVLPGTGNIGDWVIVNFISGSVATTLSVSSTAGLSELDLIPETNKIYQIYAEYMMIDASSYGWVLKHSEWTKATQP